MAPRIPHRGSALKLRVPVVSQLRVRVHEVREDVVLAPVVLRVVRALLPSLGLAAVLVDGVRTLARLIVAAARLERPAGAARAGAAPHALHARGRLCRGVCHRLRLSHLGAPLGLVAWVPR